MGDWKQNAAIVVTTAVVVAATVFTGGLAATLVGGAIGAGAVATGVGLTTAFLVGNVLSYLGGSVMNGKFLDPKEFACGNKEADAVECVSYQGGQLLTGAILTKAVGLVIPKGATTKVSNVTKSIDEVKKVPGYIDYVDDIKLKNGGSGTSTKVNIDGGEYLFDGEFYYKDGKTFLRVLDPDGSLSAAKGKMVEVGNLDPSTIRFSQNSVNGFNEVYQSMLKNGWNGDPIDVVRMSDGSLTTIDNTRLLAAKKAKIKAVVRIHEFDDVPPVARFKENPATWGEAVTNRINNQTGGFGKTNTNGSFDEPRN